jgi:hypothetical protein
VQLHFGLRQSDDKPAGHRGAPKVRAYGDHNLYRNHGGRTVQHLFDVAASAFASWCAAFATSAVADKQNTSATAIAAPAQLSSSSAATLRFTAQFSAFVRALFKSGPAAAVLCHAVRRSDNHGRHVFLQHARQRHYAAEHNIGNNRVRR